MQILLADAKIMYGDSETKPLSKPQFQTVADYMAMELAACSVDTLAETLDCSIKLAAENWRRYQNFFTSEKMPAIMAYNGQAYKHLKARTLSSEALIFGMSHLWITSFLYGLLRPMDGIVPYRIKAPLITPDGDDIIEKATRKASNRGGWKTLLTDVLIDSVNADDGILVHLSTEEYEHLFDWQRVCRELTVIHPLFYVRQKNGSLKMQAVWAKSCRGAMVRYILENGLTSPKDINAFCYEGFEYKPDLGEKLFPHFVREL